MKASEPFMAQASAEKRERILRAEIEKLNRALADLRAIETADRVNHSGHVGEDGKPCGESRTWTSKLARDVAMVLDRAGVEEVSSA